MADELEQALEPERSSGSRSFFSINAKELGLALLALLVVNVLVFLFKSPSPNEGLNHTPNEGRGNTPTFHVSAAEYGNDWPFWVDAAGIVCSTKDRAVLIWLGDTIYGLNGTAKSQGNRDPFADHPRPRDPITGAYVNGVHTISDLIKRGLDRCGWK